MSQVELQLTQQGSVLEAWRHSPCMYHHLQSTSQHPKQVEEHGVCGGMASLSKSISICGMSHRHRGVQPNTTQKLHVAHQQQLRK